MSEPALIAMMLFACFAMGITIIVVFLLDITRSSREKARIKKRCEEIRRKHRLDVIEWRSHFPDDATYNAKEWLFHFEDGREIDIDYYMISIGYGARPKLPPECDY